jgi:hypothetical protein
MPTAFFVPSQQAHPLSPADRDELYRHYEQRKAKRRKEAARSIQTYWDRQREAVPDEQEIARCYTRIKWHEHLWCTAAFYVRWSREQAWIQQSTASGYQAVLSSKAGNDERQVWPDATAEFPKDTLPPAPITIAVLAIIVATVSAFS